MSGTSDADLYRRGGRTLVASWQEYARRADGAAVHVRPGVTAAVFPTGPERSVYNNALLEDAAAVDAMERDYVAAGVGHFAAWVHESDPAPGAELRRRGYTLDSTTRAMGLDLDGLRRPRPDADLGPADWAEYLEATGLPPTLLRSADHAAFHLLVARRDGAVIAAALAYDHAGDCGVYNVWTDPDARRRGLGTALTLAQLYAARDRGCRTASLQSSAMAEGVYASVGFRDLGRILEFVPSSVHGGQV